MRYWLMKSEPDAYSIDDLEREPSGATGWDGVRNYQARNFMRDGMKVGDGILFYHSNAKPPGVAGIARVVREAYPDPTQFDPDSRYFDPKSKTEDPRWLHVDIAHERTFSRLIPLDELKETPGLEELPLVKRGNRLSVMPVSDDEWRLILALAD